jgi:hypothetical protein
VITVIVAVAVVVGTTIWVGIDHGRTTRAYGTDQMSEDAAGWVIACLFLWIVFFPWYLVARHRQRTRRPGPPEDYQDDDGVQWHRSPGGEWFYHDVAAGWVRGHGNVDPRDQVEWEAAGDPGVPAGTHRVPWLWIVLALVAGGIAALIGIEAASGGTTGTQTAASSTTTGSSPPSAQDVQTVADGCGSVPTLSSTVSYAVEENSTAPLVGMGDTTAWHNVGVMQSVTGVGYQQIAADARIFTTAWSLSETTANLAPAEHGLSLLVADCQALGLSG